MIHVIPYNANVELLRPVARKWEELTAGPAKKEFGLTIDLETHLADLQELAASPDGTILILAVDNEISGYMGLRKYQSPLGPEIIAEEHYWFVVPEKRGRTSLKLFDAAKDWAKANGCTHLKMNASWLASDLHDGVCRIYEHAGMRKFETSYIERI